MKNLLRVAAYEYRRNVFKKSFIFTLLSVPLFIAFSIGIGLFMESRGDNPQPVGIVDHAGIFNEPVIPAEIKSSWMAQYSEPIEFTAFQDEQQARTALEANQLQAYFVLPEDYKQSRQVEVIYIDEPGENAWQQWWDLLQLNLMAGQPQEIASRAASGTEYIVRSIDGKRSVPTSAPTFGLLMPLFIAAAFVLMMMMSAGYTLGAVADEKENRTMEILVTTISPVQLIGGKILGIVAISLTLLISWTIVVLLGVIIGRQAGVGWLNDLSMDWRTVIATVMIAVPSYVLAAALMTTIGVMVTSVKEGQSVSAIFFILHAIPFYVSWIFISDPHSPLAILMSVLPFTSLMTVGMRNLFTIVPTWQVALSVVVQTLGALGAIWLASRAFRTDMLRYGQRLSFRRLLVRVSRE
jgi:ABC-2 type transport system permease protein